MKLKRKRSKTKYFLEVNEWEMRELSVAMYSWWYDLSNDKAENTGCTQKDLRRFKRLSDQLVQARDFEV